VDAARSVRVVSQIRTGILDGSFPSGSPLREVALAGRYGVSRRTVREALLVLSDQGLVVHRYNAGAAVRSFDAEDITDLYRVRRMLEVEGVGSLPEVSAAALACVGTAYDDLADAAAGPDLIALARADMAFHGAVIALSGSARIDDFYQRIGMQMTYAITILQRHDVAAAVPPERIVAEHRSIRDAVLDRDGHEARRLVLEHIGTYGHALAGTVGPALAAPTRTPGR